jgi:membrane-anchored protein YejM (alkaline phosphatase superfamily)
MGAWTTYGLGSENDDLPGYIVVNGGLIPPGGLDNFTNGFLPATYQGSVFKPTATGLANVGRRDASKDAQIAKLDFARGLDRSFATRLSGSGTAPDALESAITNQELAYRMQTSVPDLLDLSGETEAIKHDYGCDSEHEPTRIFATECLFARRMVERGVRFVELTCTSVGTDRWDQHGNLREGHAANARAVDQPIAALIRDLRQRGMLDSTLVVWSGEFGRTPFAQGGDGRDHNPQAFSMWMAGGGVKGGVTVGATDDYGYRVVEKKFQVHDLHATMLHLMGIDHTRLTYRFSGRDMRLTDVHGHVIRDVLA